MDDKTRYADGMTTRRAVLGGPYVDKASSGLTDFNGEWQEFITRTAWNDIWNRPGLPRRERSIIVLAIAASLGAWGEFRIHVPWRDPQRAEPRRHQGGADADGDLCRRAGRQPCL